MLKLSKHPLCAHQAAFLQEVWESKDPCFSSSFEESAIAFQYALCCHVSDDLKPRQQA
jgi:hypothetical protein